MLVSRFLKEHDPGLAKGADMDWESVRDAFFEENGEKYVAAWWNGSGPGSGGRQSCSFLTDRTPPYGKPYALVSIWIDEAKTFDDKDSAEKFLLKQDGMRPRPLEGWFVTRIADLEKRIGYRVNTKESIMGSMRPPARFPGP